MSARAHRGASVQPDSNSNEKNKMVIANRLQNQKSAKKADGDNSSDGSCTRSCSFRLPRRGNLFFSPLRYLRFLSGKMAAAYRLISGRKRVASTASERSKSSFVAPVDSHRAEAIDDCIEFINNSSSFPRSNSVSS